MNMIAELLQAPQQVILSNNPLDFLTTEDSYTACKRKNTQSTRDIVTLQMLCSYQKEQ